MQKCAVCGFETYELKEQNGVPKCFVCRRAGKQAGQMPVFCSICQGSHPSTECPTLNAMEVI